MKKRIWVCSCVFAFIIICIISFCTLGESKKFNMMSQIQYNYFFLKEERYVAEFSCGLREEVFDYDGVSTSKVHYGIIKVKLLNSNNYASRIKIYLSINKKSQDFILEKNPFEDNFVTDTYLFIKETDIVEIFVENVNTEYKQMNCISKHWISDCHKVLNISFKENKQFIKENSKNGKSCECYLSVIYNKYQDTTNYYWLFQIYTSSLKSKYIVLDVNDLEIVCKQ